MKMQIVLNVDVFVIKAPAPHFARRGKISTIAPSDKRPATVAYTRYGLWEVGWGGGLEITFPITRVYCQRYEWVALSGEFTLVPLFLRFLKFRLLAKIYPNYKRLLLINPT